MLFFLNGDNMEKFNFKKSLGQNFIKDDLIIDKIINAAEIDSNTLAIEIGPGAGALSKEIVSRAKFTILYEIDERLEKVLRDKLCDYNNYELIIKDVLDVSLSDDIAKHSYEKVVVVANIPYYITTPIVRKLIDDIYPDRIVIMIQEEVANRITSLPGSKEYGFMSVFVQSKYNACKLFRVDKKYFTPIPKVDSAVIKLDKNSTYNINNNDFFVKFIQDSFRYKRKNIKNNLNNYDLKKIEEILTKHNIFLTDRSEDIPVDVFVTIANELSK